MSILFCEIVFDMMKIISDHLQSVNYKWKHSLQGRLSRFRIGNSWADKVKGMSPPQNQTPLMPSSIPLSIETDISHQIVQEHIIAEKEFFKDQQKVQGGTDGTLHRNAFPSLMIL